MVAEEDMAAHEDEDLKEDVAMDASPMNCQSENAFTAQKKTISRNYAVNDSTDYNSTELHA